VDLQCDKKASAEPSGRSLKEEISTSARHLITSDPQYKELEVGLYNTLAQAHTKPEFVAMNMNFMSWNDERSLFFERTFKLLVFFDAKNLAFFEPLACVWFVGTTIQDFGVYLFVLSFPDVYRVYMQFCVVSFCRCAPNALRKISLNRRPTICAARCSYKPCLIDLSRCSVWFEQREDLCWPAISLRSECA
jgi:hypothetical protein